MNNMPLVSVIMGAYNCEKTVGAAIDSIVEQTYTNWELIVCDDSSSDRTLDILMDYAKKDSRIRVLHNEMNLRLAASLNKCLAVANGSYIARMDADDCSLPDRFAKEVAFLNENKKFDVVGCLAYVYDGKNKKGVRCVPQMMGLPQTWSTTPFIHPTIMMRKTAYDALDGYSSNELTCRAEDLDLWFRFFEKGYQGYNIQEPYYVYTEKIVDYKKRSLRAAVLTAKLRMFWHRRLHIPKRYDYLIWKIVVVALIPNFVSAIYHRFSLR
jgi:glycosyltransferase EpsE